MIKLVAFGVYMASRILHSTAIAVSVIVFSYTNDDYDYLFYYMILYHRWSLLIY